ncbi:toxin-antitoxin system YwqK family antitoxin [Cyclobacterium marinum]|uniref:toxin-antitoxin system YwqK family antitoxin n=1 Tax=Cyclobacterium marinum TaxID=104 RepID=UPI0011EEF524|nr:toxin-antitoxin system YwqK family antitoxin [Cyclobacterium marinum]MBI0400072.1 toxin-antitoxin system YwqK family antitoxin [Cyclobacterium marinum]
MSRLKLIFFLVLAHVIQGCNNFEIVGSYENGVVKEECEFINGRKNGFCKGYYPSGNLEYLVKFKDDILHGKSIFLHENGRVHWEVIFNKGVKNGNVKYYDENGRVFQVSSFKNNELHGTTINYYPCGTIKSKMTYYNGMLNGDFYSYYEQGNLKMKAYYEEDVLIDFVSYSLEGEVMDHLIQYEIMESNNIFKVKSLNQHFDVVGVSMGIKDHNGEIKTIGESISNDGIFTLRVPEKYRGSDEFYFQLYEMDSLEDNPDEGVVRSKIEFVY